MESATTRRSRLFVSGRWRLTLLALLALVNADYLVGQDKLPAVRQLLAETLALCNADREENRTALNDLAAAQCYLGDFTAARKTLVPYEPGNIFQLSAHHKCARIEIALTGSEANIPAALWADELGFMHSDAALAYSDRGDYDNAQQHLDAIPKSHPGVFSLFCPKLIPQLRAAQQPAQCRKVLRVWASSYENTKSIFQYRDSQAPRLVAWLVEFDERPTAVALCEHWHSILKAAKSLDNGGEFIGRGWGDYAVALAALDDQAGAQQALEQASEWTDRAFLAKTMTEERSTYHDFARAYAALAARQAVVLGREESQAAYHRAYELAQITNKPPYGEYAYERIVAEQLVGGDLSGIRQTIRRMIVPRSIARAWRSVCEHALQHTQADAAIASAREAADWFMQNEFKADAVHDMSSVAATAAVAGEAELAQKLFRRSLDLSEKHKDPKFAHASIASGQIHAGLLRDGFATIQTIPEASDRLRPLASLCLALAQAESEGRK